MRNLLVLPLILLGSVAVVKAEKPGIAPEAMLQKLKAEELELEMEIKVLRNRLDTLETRITENKNMQSETKTKHEWQKKVRKQYLQDLKKANEKVRTAKLRPTAD